ncbi:TIGR02117 family protein [Sphingobium algorifonticola]|uniref:TIGR02117 family protein n=2 Tax=Sphingobium algorifonticola TaxID=2008318 RepID=A0A437JA47_9SPHN|nr:TIGR02117 family protein [Sphingobium algorifonticola]
MAAALAGLLIGLLIGPLLFALAVVGGSLMPANADAVPPDRGVTIYVNTNGVHTGIVMPTVHPLHDWRGRAPAADLPDPRRAGPWVLIGWGDRDFFLNTPTWAEVDPRVVLRAALGNDDTLMHVDHLQRLWRGPDLRPVVLSADQYRALARAIEADFAGGTAIPGYGPGDVFYPAHGRYSAIRTCNAWTGDRLRAVGIRIGYWTPLSWSVMRWF